MAELVATVFVTAAVFAVAYVAILTPTPDNTSQENNR